MKRISMAGSDVAVTDERVAALVLEYAKELGRAGTTDTVTVPIADREGAGEASLLLGPASQIAVTQNHDAQLERVELLRVEPVLGDLRARLDRLIGTAPRPLLPEEQAGFGSGLGDFDDYGA